MSWKVYTRTKDSIVWQLRLGEKISEVAVTKGDDGLWYVYYKPSGFVVETVNTPNKSKAVAMAFARLWMREHKKG